MAMVYRCVGILTVDVIVFFRSHSIFHSQDSLPSTFHPWLWETSSGVVAVGVFTAEARKELQRTYLQWPLLRMSPTVVDETSRGRNPDNGRPQDFGRRWHRQSGFQYTYWPWSSSLELFNKSHNAGCESLCHLILVCVVFTDIYLIMACRLLSTVNKLIKTTYPKNLAPTGPSSRIRLARASPSMRGGGWLSLSRFR